MRAVNTSARLRLASHVRACESDGQVILLDLLHNRYLGIGNPMSQALAMHVIDWPVSAASAGACPAAAGMADPARLLISKGLLTKAPPDPLPDTHIGEATASLDLEQTSQDPALNARRLGRFLRSAAVASWWMHGRSLQWIAMAVAARRDRIKGPDANSLDAMRSGAAAYAKLRPLLITAQERCLQDSLALVCFLAAEGTRPQWVVGVKTGPFGAHSWVQSGNTVLNDQHEYVRRFRPILVV